MNQPEPFLDSQSSPAVRGFWHASPAANYALVLTHGAGLNCNAPLLKAVATEFAASGISVLRCDLPFRQERPFGPPNPSGASRDRDGLKNAVAAAQRLVAGRVFLGGHSYGGRQATMLCAEQPELVAGLLLLSYPLHPPNKPEQLRTQHFASLKIPALFVHGTRDGFGSADEIERALKLIPARTALVRVDGTGHDLGFKGKSRREGLGVQIASKFAEFFSSSQ